MSNKVVEINVLKQLFLEENIKYIIPLYQRAFAWESDEIFQLIEDINDIKTENYFLGTLIVSRNKDIFEVIDGQQRLTTLYLLFYVLGIQTKEILFFDCREKSNYTLTHLNKKNFNENECETSLLNGIKEIEKTIIEKETEDNDFKNKFMDKLEKVKLYRIEVPENTDLNRYFEIMNTRGEQLEQADILKANLMSYIVDDTSFDEEKTNKSNVFAEIWDACSDMNRYFQMNFNKSDREILFGENWNRIPVLENLLNNKAKNNEDKNNENKELIIGEIDKFKEEYIEKETEIEDRDSKRRFGSIINFPYFLLHALRIFVENENIVPESEEKGFLGKLLDDKELVKDFNNVVENGVWKGSKINRKQFSMRFIDFLLELRFLFDKYIIKRQYTDVDKDGEWSLKELKVSNTSNSKKAYPINTNFEENDEETNRKVGKINLMIQSCLRVSYTSPKNMHWITELLKWLYKKSNSDYPVVGEEFVKKAEEIAQNACKEFFHIKAFENMGVHTPHIVFNYLDYLLWDESGKEDDFIFEFRNSVEHWYPQKPEGFPKWENTEELDHFGNLCLIQRDINSRFSNLAPSAKNDSFEDIIRKGSLKLRLMAKEIKLNSEDTNTYWRTKGYLLHGKKMINILKKACEID